MSSHFRRAFATRKRVVCPLTILASTPACFQAVPAKHEFQAWPMVPSNHYSARDIAFDEDAYLRRMSKLEARTVSTIFINLCMLLGLLVVCKYPP
ncbi:hypothetical protein BR93DRAFT_922628 [Coniochaeta sp. PMI_546]|nr:hypothetical protein BR93DRAFT_922628 [Coniochaeta sp. PMI_546]